MWQYFARRFLLAILTFLLSTFVIFAVIQWTPGGPVEQAILQMKMAAASGEGGAGAALDGAGDVQISERAIESLKKYYKLDRPWPVRYAHWLGSFLALDWGESYKYERPVLKLITDRFHISIYLGLIGFVLAYAICIPLGIAKAVKHNSAFDFATSTLVFIGYSLPGWAVGYLLLFYLGGRLDLFPLAGFRPPGWEEMDWWGKVRGQLHHTALPIVSYMLGSFATLTILTKNSLMENLGQDYVRTAFAKGLSEKRVILLHAMRNSLIPLATGLGHLLSLVLAGSFLIEKVFSIDGLGRLGYEAVINKDQNVVMGILGLGIILQLFGNMMQDLLYSVFDPRIRFR